MSTQVATTQKKGGYGKKGLIVRGKGGKKIHIIIDDEKYSVSVKALKEVLNGSKGKTALWGY